MKTTVVNKYRHTPTSNDTYIGRGSTWGNDYSHTGNSKYNVIKVATREEAIARYEEDFLKDPVRLDLVSLLKGRYLVCFCKNKACHGDVLAKYAEMPREELDKLIAKAEANS